LWVEALKPNTSIISGALPVNTNLVGIALVLPRHGFVSYRLKVGHTPIQTWLTEHAQFDLCTIPPASMLGRVGEL
jgi:hypothetical protein